MNYPVPSRLDFPILPYQVTGYCFGQRVRSRFWLPAWHLGDDIIAVASTPVQAIGEGEVLWSATRPGSAHHRNWGGLLIVGHTSRHDNHAFYSLYGHVKDLHVAVGERVVAGQTLGIIAPGPSTENGWWKTAHLHFAIYIGPWVNQVLPGYKRLWQRRTKMAWWANPQEFIIKYNG